MSIEISAVSALIGTMYDAAIGVSHWETVTVGIRDLFGASRVCIVQATPIGLHTIGSEHDHELSSAATVEVLMRSPTVLRVAALPAGRTAPWEMAYGIEHYRSEFFNDFCRPRDMVRGVVMKLTPAGDNVVFADVAAGRQQAGFDDEAIRALDALTPHLIRAGHLGPAGAPLQEGDDRIGLLLIDRDGEVLASNEQAEGMLENRLLPVRLVGRRLTGAGDRVAANLDRLVQQATFYLAGELPGVGGSMLLDTKDGRLELSVEPYRRRHRFGTVLEQLALVTLRPLAMEGHTTNLEARITELFALTPAEARIAAALSTGATLAEGAAANGVTIKTARTYLERIFRKTSTHHQGELIVLLHRLRASTASPLQ